VVSWVIVNQALVAEAREFEHLPEDLDLAYEDISFQPRGGEDITLRGWWLPANDGSEPLATIIWVHGLDGTRAARLPFLADMVDAGFDVLTFDLRGHGESDKALMGAGLHEQNDLRGAIDYALDERGVPPGRLLLVGSSLGAAIVLEVGPDEPAVAGVYADSSFAALSDMIAEEVAKRTPLPLFAAKLLKPGLITVGRVTKGIDLDAVKPAEAAARYPYRIGIAHCETDERIPFEHAIEIWRNMPPGSAFVSYPCGHADGYNEFPELYVNNVVQYLTARLAARLAE
ncbi:MAG: alpha/beta fold hydrolase, partial [Dehalococcoidia bacterium]